MEHHHHSTINNYAYIHDHDPADHDADGRHTPRHNDGRLDRDGATPDDDYFGPAHYNHKPTTLLFNDDAHRRQYKHRHFRWAL